jgi:hypothetical protein
MRRRQPPPDPETASVLAGLARAALVLAARARGGDRMAVQQGHACLTTIDSIQAYGYDGLERIRASRYLREAGVPGGQVNGKPVSLPSLSGRG